MFDKIVIITKKTYLEELIERFNTKGQAKFYIEHSGGSFNEYEASHNEYKHSIDCLYKLLPSDSKYQFVEREFLPNFLFGDKDLVITVGPDGLVINTAKYLNNQPILAINPDLNRIDGVMIPFSLDSVKQNFMQIFDGKYSVSDVSMAKATLNDGQVLYGVNDIFIGARTHVSFRYNLTHKGYSEEQSSSGIIVSTGAGSTGWFRSVITGARGISHGFEIGEQLPKKKKKTKKVRSDTDNYSEQDKKTSRFAWDSRYLYYSVREPFPSKVSDVNLIFGKITEGKTLDIESHMPQNGVIFSDGIEKDFLAFNSGKSVKIGVAEKSAKLIECQL